jgi:hypothetical protein
VKGDKDVEGSQGSPQGNALEAYRKIPTCLGCGGIMTQRSESPVCWTDGCRYYGQGPK